MAFVLIACSLFMLLDADWAIQEALPLGGLPWREVGWGGWVAEVAEGGEEKGAKETLN